MIVVCDTRGQVLMDKVLRDCSLEINFASLSTNILAPMI